MEPLDEYTALQKYISTYKDPKAAADSPENQQKDAADATKSKKWWQVSPPTKPFDRNTCLQPSVLEIRYLWPGH